MLDDDPRAYRGPERRAGLSLAQRRMAQMLDAIDYGMLLLSEETLVLHVNKAARRELDEQHPLQLLGQQLRSRLTQDVLPLRDALAAAGRGLRRLLTLGDGPQRSTVAVVPLAPVAGEAQHGVLLVLGKRQVCETLSVEWFARSHGLTMAETAVLKGLCASSSPQEIADQQGVRLSTVRTQIGSIRAKTGADSIRGLVRQVAVLPPLVDALQLGGAPQAWPLRA